MSDAILYIQLGRQVSTSFDYDAAKAAMSARCYVDGVVWNAGHSGRLFQGASVQITFLDGIDDRMKKYAEEHGLQGACGNIEIAKNLEPESFESNGEKIMLPQISIWVGIDRESFKLIESGIKSSLTNSGISSMSVTFGHRDFTGIFMLLERLDISEKSNYPIVSFNVSCSNGLVAQS